MRRDLLATLRRLHSHEKRRGRVVEALLGDEPVLVGSLSLVNRTCGKPSCHCATKPGHPVWVLATTQQDRRRCQVVRLADVDEVRERVEAYKKFKTLLREFETIHREEIGLLRGLRENRNMPYE